ncbi:MAG TPA: class D sortase [Candidatus Saccharimonadales bacterium]|nr:class D sortase [Candidatus Saccharimonadales bacterium]
MNPLFPDDNPASHTMYGNNGYVLPRQERRLEPLAAGEDNHDRTTNPAVELIRRKIDALYAEEPNAKEELTEAKQAVPPRSRHQQYMYELSTSGKSLADIQTAWHTYYVNLPDEEKRAVWQEFYTANARHPSNYTRFVQQHAAKPPEEPIAKSKSWPKHEEPPHKAVIVSHHTPAPLTKLDDKRNFATIKKQVTQRVRANGRVRTKAKHHLQSLAFGLGSGAVVLLIFLFGLFNEVVIAPFIQPNSRAEATPIILNENSVAPSDTNEVIIPKINAQLPIIYGSQSIVEEDVQKALQDGIFHYPTTAIPGQQGNAAYFGHSSNNIFNKGKFKFAFVLLNDLQPGDIFYLTYNKKVYTYKVFQKKVVEPTDTWVLGPVQGKAATAALITCDPPGTTLHRLVVWGEQITPDPTGNTTAATPSEVLTSEDLPGNGPTLLGRFWSWITPW